MDATRLDVARLRRRRSRAARRADGPAPGTRRVELSRASVRTRIAGSGRPTVVLAPDPPNVIEHYEELIDLLSSRFRVVCYELPGFGLSWPKGGFRFTLEDQVSAARELLGELALGPYVLALPCVAAYVGLRLAADPRAQVERVVAIQAPSWTQEVDWARRVDPRGLLRMPVVGQAMMALGQRRMARGWYRAALPKGYSDEPFLDPALESFDRGACFCLGSAFQGLFRGQTTELEPVEKPTLAVWGTADRTHRPSEPRSLLEHAPGAEVVELDGVAHFPDLERPERFSELLRDFAG